MSNEPQVKILGYEGNPFSANYNMIVRCTIMDTSHWRRGRKFEDEEFKEWNYVPYYLAEMQISNKDKNSKDGSSGIRSFRVIVMMSQSYMQWWHRSKGAGYNNSDARRVFVDEWNKYLEKERESEEKPPVIDPDLVWAGLKNNINNN
jgi:hypothetical protein